MKARALNRKPIQWESSRLPYQPSPNLSYHVMPTPKDPCLLRGLDGTRR